MVRLLICGDFRAKNASKITVGKQFKSIILQSDYSICNFEAPVYSKGQQIKKSGPTLDQDIKSIDFLSDLGFNVVLLGNNHIMDYGEDGCKATMQSCEENNITYVGAGLAKDAYQVRIVEKSGLKIGFLSLVQHEFGVVESLNETSFGTAWINSYEIEEIIKTAKQKVDFLFVLPHAGVEHIDAPLPEWRRCYRKIVDWGADMIIASHPHCPQGWELYNDKYIFYSLGNFYFDELSGGDYWNKSLAVEICIDKGLSVNTYNVTFDKNGRIDIDETEESKNHIEYLNRLLNNEESYLNYINDICQSHYEGQKYGLLRGVCGFSIHMRLYYCLRLFVLMLMGNRDEMYLLNSLQNESHRWLIERFLRNSTN